MTITELKETAIIYQMAYYVAKYTNYFIGNDFVTYCHIESQCWQSSALDFKRYETYKQDVFNVPIRDLISAQALDKIYLEIDKEPELRLKNIDALVAMIKWHYKEFINAKGTI